MCGIIGFNWNDKALLETSLNHISHRGPDNRGIYVDDILSLGAARLSIIDLTQAGIQPMKYCNNAKEAIIVYDGEVYNFQILKKKLMQKGYEFQSRTDTEVVLASYLEYGFDCVKKFNGMWAFSLYDLEKELLFLSRDRLGQKPLHYYFDESRFIFCSEIKGILEHKIEKLVDYNSIDLYFSLGFIPAPYTIYKKIKKLEPRQNLIFDLKRKGVQKYIYYQLPRYKPEKNRKKLVIEGRNLLNDATRLRLIADVPIGAFLSGGLDSSTVVATMSKSVDLKSLNTFSIGFDGKFDETPYIEAVKDYFETVHHHYHFREEDLEMQLEELFYYYDEPFGDQSLFPTSKLSEFAKRYVKVSLSGDGGDEIFGGYPTHQTGAQLSLIRKIPKIIRWLFYKALPKTSNTQNILSRLKEGFRLSLIAYEEFYADGLKDEEYRPEFYIEWITQKLKDCLVLSGGDFTEALIKLDYYYLTMADNYLLKVDRASMKNGVEVRSPFLDYRFIEYSSKIPSKWKTSATKRKILMREIIQPLLPEKIVKRRKQGFLPPLEDWIIGSKYIEELNSQIERLVRMELLNEEWKKFYHRIITKTQKNQRDKTYLIRLFLFGKWAEYWLN